MAGAWLLGALFPQRPRVRQPRRPHVLNVLAVGAGETPLIPPLCCHGGWRRRALQEGEDFAQEGAKGGIITGDGHPHCPAAKVGGDRVAGGVVGGGGDGDRGWGAPFVSGSGGGSGGGHPLMVAGKGGGLIDDEAHVGDLAREELRLL